MAVCVDTCNMSLNQIEMEFCKVLEENSFWLLTPIYFELVCFLMGFESLCYSKGLQSFGSMQL